MLLVEDNSADVGLVREALEEHRVEGDLLVISDGEQAILFINSIDMDNDRVPDLIILDLNLPRKSGREVLHHLRRSKISQALPVLILTSSDATSDRQDAMGLGATRYIRKPSRLSEFLELGGTFKVLLESPPE